MKPRRLVSLASTRLLNSGPDSCARIERQAIRAIEAADWKGARRLLHLRLAMAQAPTPEERKVIGRVLELIEQAEACGIGQLPLDRIVLAAAAPTTLECPVFL